MKKISTLLLVLILALSSVVGFAAELNIKGKQNSIDIVTFAESSLHRLLKLDPKARPESIPPMTGFLPSMMIVFTSTASVWIKNNSLDIARAIFYLPIEKSEDSEKALYKLIAGVSALEQPSVWLDEPLSMLNKSPLDEAAKMVGEWLEFTDSQREAMRNGKSVLVHSSDKWDYEAGYLKKADTDIITDIAITATPR